MDIGDSSSTISPLFEGFLIQHAVKRSPIGGQVLLDMLMTNLEENGVVSLRTSYEREFTGRDILMQKAGDGVYTLPDGNKITVADEQAKSINQAFFKPKSDLENLALQNLLDSSIADCDVDLRDALRKNLILAGGVTLLPNFED